jgi:pimeloyl-ACP methyl ester carboxylesterase
MTRLGSAKDPGNASGNLTRLLDGLPVTERRLDVGEISTPVLEGGAGSPVVLLHGIGGYAPEWSMVIPQLVGRHRVVVPDLPGLGGSRVRAGRLDAASVVDWLGDVIEQTCSEPPTLVGHSLGGSVAVRFAIEHGDRVRQVILVDSTSLSRQRPAPGLILAILRFGARPTQANHDRFLRQVLFDAERAKATWGDRWSATAGYDMELAKNKEVSKATGQLLRRIANRRIPREQLAKVPVPIALIWGTEDRLMRYRIARQTADRLGWPLYPIEDCGHGPHIECPLAFVTALETAMAVPSSTA